MKGPGSGIPGRWRARQLRFPARFWSSGLCGWNDLDEGRCIDVSWLGHDVGELGQRLGWFGTVNEREGMVKMGWYAGGWRAHGLFGWYLRRGIGLNPSPRMEKMGSPLHLAHHGLTPNRLLSVFYVSFPVCGFGRLAGEKGWFSPQEDQSWTPSHQSTLSFEQVYKSNSWRKSWPKNRNPEFLEEFLCGRKPN